jgi:hypothetical protein
VGPRPFILLRSNCHAGRCEARNESDERKRIGLGIRLRPPSRACRTDSNRRTAPFFAPSKR